MKKRLKIWTVALLVLFLLSALAVSNAFATHSAQDNHLNRGTGTLTFTQIGTVSGPKVINDHTTITVVKETLSFTGNLTGSAIAIERDVTHTVTHEGKTITFTTFHGRGNLTGTLGPSSVTLHIRYEGVKNNTFARGNFVISGDTGLMVDIHGEGHFRGSIQHGEGSSPAVDYKMHWTLATHAEHPEAKDENEHDDD